MSMNLCNFGSTVNTLGLAGCCILRYLGRVAPQGGTQEGSVVEVCVELAPTIGWLLSGTTVQKTLVPGSANEAYIFSDTPIINP